MNTETKRHIDGARQVLVGVVPNPTSQIDQITNALIYKFMDDMDQAAIKAGGDPSFFTGNLEKYAWTRLMDARMGNQERMNLYSEALLKFSESPQLPALFRGIFKSAFLPYRSPEVLGLFLKEIDFFDYSHSEELGNAFEYLLSVMGSQGDAGMFRTPRHIIDFIVDVVNPTKDDKILDPACGTAGFLISAYKNILEQHDGKDDPEKKEKPLTPDQKKNLIENFQGYDISPEMVRLSRVNMYLHQFKNPQIFAYNTLADKERWNDKFDVILANPPFMTPKGAGKPHSKFTIQASKSEVLFVDYIMNHLRPKGRAGIIVPEGIIFSSGSAYKQLRKNLVEDGLYAVVSLPSGVFNPYAGVKTSILLFNNELAKVSKEILFVKIENDGFDLGAQRRESQKNDLPIALEILNIVRTMIEKGLCDYHDSLNKWIENHVNPLIKKIKIQTVKKSKIAEDGDYNLSGDRYRIATDYSNAKWPMVKLGEVIHLDFGDRITKNNKQGTKYPVYGGGGESFRTDEFNRENEYVIARFAMSEHCVRFVAGQFWMMDSGGTFSIKPEYQDRLNKDFVGKILLSRQEDIFMCARGGAQKNLNNDHFYELKIPLPPLEIQEQIVAELDGYQNIISGAKQITQNWKPKIDIDPKWESAKIGEVAKLMTGGTPLTSKKEYYGGDIKWLVSGDINQGEIFDCDGRITTLALKESNVKLLPINSVLIALNGQGKTRGTVAILRTEATCNQSLVSIIPEEEKILPEFLWYVLRGKYQEIRNINGDNQRGGLNMPIIRGIEIPLPPLAIQKQIVEKIEAERALVDGNKKLVEIYERKTKDVIAKLWEE